VRGAQQIEGGVRGSKSRDSKQLQELNDKNYQRWYRLNRSIRIKQVLLFQKDEAEALLHQCESGFKASPEQSELFRIRKAIEVCVGDRQRKWRFGDLNEGKKDIFLNNVIPDMIQSLSRQQSLKAFSSTMETDSHFTKSTVGD
jgi:hypothetical protein